MAVLLQNFKNVFFVADLRRKLLITFGIFAVYRLGVNISIPGVDILALKNFFAQSGSGFLSYFDLFSGGALQNFSVFALGMSPYISSSIMMQVLTIALPSLEMLSKEGAYGRQIISQYTRYLTLAISIVQGLGISMYLESLPQHLVLTPGWSFRLFSVLVLCVGSLFVMWLGEQINTFGLGNGSSMIIFAAIVATLPNTLIKLIASVNLGQSNLFEVGFLVLFTLLVMACVVFLERGERKINVQYAKRIVGNKLYGGQSSYIPLKLNPAGVVPVIFATAMLGLPLTIANLIATRWPYFQTVLNHWFAYDGVLYNVLNAGLIIFFSFIYTNIIFNPVDLADNLRKSGGFIPGFRPGFRTAEYFDYLLTRIGFPGALYLATLAILPSMFRNAGIFPLMFSGVSLLIVVGVAMDTSAQIESHLIERQYAGFLSSGRLKRRMG